MSRGGGRRASNFHGSLRKSKRDPGMQKTSQVPTGGLPGQSFLLPGLQGRHVTHTWTVPPSPTFYSPSFLTSLSHLPFSVIPCPLPLCVRPFLLIPFHSRSLGSPHGPASVWSARTGVRAAEEMQGTCSGLGALELSYNVRLDVLKGIPTGALGTCGRGGLESLPR